MHDDLVSLRMLVVVPVPAEREFWRRGAAMASIPVDICVQDAVTATDTLARGGVDICVLDSSLPAAYKAGVIKVARAIKSLPLVFVSAPQGSDGFDGADGMLHKPTSIEEARKLAEVCIRAKFPTRVLIVDDSSTMRSIVRKILAASRFRLDVREASEGLAALGQVQSGVFGLVFLDYNMPGFNGFETLAEIKRANPSIAVVMMTSTIDNAIADRAHAAGAFAFLNKPFFPADIDAILARYYGLQHQAE